MSVPRCAWALVGVVLAPALTYGQPPPGDVLFPPASPLAASPLLPSGSAPSQTTASLMQSLRPTLEALGASSGVTDGVGGAWYPARPVRGQSTQVGLANLQAGLTIPVFDTAEQSAFANPSAQVLTVSGQPLLPNNRGRVPARLWDIQLGGTYVRQTEDKWSWGLALSGGSASDRPFASIHEATVAAMGFVRVPKSDADAWLFYLVSTSNGQVGHNIPIPGAAYEFHREQLNGVVGFPFFNLHYRPVDCFEWELQYAALTDVQARLNYRPADPVKLFTGFAWTNHAWFRADRTANHRQLFLYEKHLESGLIWQALPRANLQLSAGYAFDRYFTESFGFSLGLRHRVDIGSGPFIAAQLEIVY